MLQRARAVSTAVLSRHPGNAEAQALMGEIEEREWIVTADDGLDPNNLRVTCRVNGVTKQDSNTKFLYFKLPRLIRDLSIGMTLVAIYVFKRAEPSFAKVL